MKEELLQISQIIQDNIKDDNFLTASVFCGILQEQIHNLNKNGEIEIVHTKEKTCSLTQSIMINS